MKKFIAIILIYLCLSCNVVNAAPKVTSNVLQEGIYSVSEITESLGKNLNYVQNISSNNSSYFMILDKNHNIVKSIRMEPNSEKFILGKLQPDYDVIIIGDGSIFLS